MRSSGIHSAWEPLAARSGAPCLTGEVAFALIGLGRDDDDDHSHFLVDVGEHNDSERGIGHEHFIEMPPPVRPRPTSYSACAQ